MKILWITRDIPYPPIKGYSIRIYNFMTRISLEHEIYLFSLKEIEEPDHDIDGLRRVCKEVGFSLFHKGRSWSKPFEFLSYLLREIPPDFRFFLAPHILRDLVNFIGERKFDIVQIEDLQLALFLDYLPKHLGAKTVLDFQDVDFRKYDRIYHFEKKITRRLRIWLHSRILRKWEPDFAGRFDLCLAISDIDKKLLLDANPRIHAETLPNGIELAEYRISPIQNPTPTIIFVGSMDYLPNVDAVIYFVEQIFPYIRQQVPGVEFHIVGNEPRPSVYALAGNGVVVTGQVPDVKPYYQQSWVSVVPLRAGGGIRNKILEAMALGRPTVSTTIGCEGLRVTHDKDILVSDDPHEFGELVVRLFRDEDLRARLIENGRQTVEKYYNWNTLAKQAVELYQSLIE